MKSAPHLCLGLVSTCCVKVAGMCEEQPLLVNCCESDNVLGVQYQRNNGE